MISVCALLAASEASAAPDWNRPPAPSSTISAADYGGSITAPLTLPLENGKLFGFNDRGGLFRAYGGGLTPDQHALDASIAGANSNRIAISWAEEQPDDATQHDPGYLPRVAELVDALNRRGVEPLLVLYDAPRWARNAAGTGASGIANTSEAIDAFGKWARYVSDYFGGVRIAGIETWNEPNMAGWWGDAWSSSASVYARAHVAAYQAIKAGGAHPDIKVIFGSLVPSTVTTGRGSQRVFRAQQYLYDAYRAGLRPWHYDAVSFHPYPGQWGYGLPSATGLGDRAFGTGTHYAKQWNDLLTALNWAHQGREPARLWITETGITTSRCQVFLGRCVYPRKSGLDGCGGLLQVPCQPAIQVKVDPATQRTELVRLLRKLLSHPRVDAVFVNGLYERPGSQLASEQPGFGVMVATPVNDGAWTDIYAKPAYCGLLDLQASVPAVRGC